MEWWNPLQDVTLPAEDKDETISCSWSWTARDVCPAQWQATWSDWMIEGKYLMLKQERALMVSRSDTISENNMHVSCSMCMVCCDSNKSGVSCYNNIVLIHLQLMLMVFMSSWKENQDVWHCFKWYAYRSICCNSAVIQIHHCNQNNIENCYLMSGICASSHVVWHNGKAITHHTGNHEFIISML
jgi:hypothetical protein